MTRYTGEIISLELTDKQLDEIKNEMSWAQGILWAQVRRHQENVLGGADRVDEYIRQRFRHLDRINVLRQPIEAALWERRQQIRDEIDTW